MHTVIGTNMFSILLQNSRKLYSGRGGAKGSGGGGSEGREEFVGVFVAVISALGPHHLCLLTHNCVC